MKTKTMLAAVMTLAVVSAPATLAVSDSLADMLLKKAADEMAVDTTGVADVEKVVVEEVTVDPLAGTVPAEERSWEEDDAAPCSDGIDNDGDGKIDFGEDLGCVAADDDSEEDEAAKEEVKEEEKVVVAEEAKEAEPKAVAVDPLAALFDAEDYEEVAPVAEPVVEDTTDEIAEPMVEEVSPSVVSNTTTSLPKSGPAVLGVLAIAGAGAAIRKKFKK